MWPTPTTCEKASVHRAPWWYLAYREAGGRERVGGGESGSEEVRGLVVVVVVVRDGVACVSLTS